MSQFAYVLVKGRKSGFLAYSWSQMLHFDGKFFLTFIAVFIAKIDGNCYDFLAFCSFSAGVAWKNVVSVVHCLVTIF